MNIGIILAGGIGSRFGADKPKQYCKILGKEMILYSIDAFKNAKK
ncbi:MAG: NTP transferase domain-containing protein, partial [Clostridia bacterium]|nr:NTP transferase domain-containing protein [Clostridia bacterium]